MYTLQMAHMLPDVSGRMTFIHKLNLYVHSVLERQTRLYEWLLRYLKDLLNVIGILSTGHLPPFLFPSTILESITTNVLLMVKKSHPNFVLAIKHLTEYYGMKLATFGVDTDGNMIVVFPVFGLVFRLVVFVLFRGEFWSVKCIETSVSMFRSTELRETHRNKTWNKAQNKTLKQMKSAIELCKILNCMVKLCG